MSTDNMADVQKAVPEKYEQGSKNVEGWEKILRYVGIGLLIVTVAFAIYQTFRDKGGSTSGSAPAPTSASYMYCWEADDGKPSGLAGVTEKCFILNDFSPEDGTMKSQVFENRDGSRSQATYKVCRVGPDQYEGTWFELNDKRGVTREGKISFSMRAVPPVVASGSHTSASQSFSFDIKKL